MFGDVAKAGGGTGVAQVRQPDQLDSPATACGGLATRRQYLQELARGSLSRALWLPVS